LVIRILALCLAILFFLARAPVQGAERSSVELPKEAAKSADSGMTSTEQLDEDVPLNERPPVERLLDRPVEALRLTDATVRALESNTGLAISRITPEIDKEQILVAKGPFDAILTTSANYSRATSQPFPDPNLIVPGQPKRAVDRSSVFETDLTKRWATGTQTGINFKAQRLGSNANGVEYDSALNFSIRQSLLRGLNPKANLATIREAENNYKSSLYGLQSDVITTVANVETTYWDLALAYELLSVQQFSMDLAQKQLDRTQAFVDVGKRSPLELTNAQAELATRKRDFLRAKNNVEKTAVDMLNLIASDTDDIPPPALPRPSVEAKLPVIPGSDQDSLRRAFTLRPDLYQANLNFQNGQLEVVRTRDGVLPQLDLVGTYGLTGRGFHFSDAQDRLQDADFDQYSVGVEFQVPIPNRAARGQFHAAKATEKQFLKSIDNLRHNIKAEVLKARIDLANQIAGVDAARASVDLQEQKLRNEEERWRRGIGTILDVFQAQRDLISSRNDLFISIASALKSETNLYVQEGSLLEVRGISAEGGKELK